MKGLNIDTNDIPIPSLNKSASPQEVSVSNIKKKTLNPLKKSFELAVNNSSSFEFGKQKNVLRSTSPKDRIHLNTESPISMESDSTNQLTATPSPAFFSQSEVLMQNQKLQQQEALLKKSVHQLRKKEKKLLQSIDTLSKNEEILKRDHNDHLKQFKDKKKELNENTQFLHRQKKEMELTLEEMHEQETEVRKSLENTELEYSMLSKQIINYKKELEERTNLEKDSQQLRSQISRLKEEKAQFEDSIESMRSKKQSLQAEIDHLQSKKIELNQSIDHLRDAFESTKSIKETEAEQEVTRSIQQLIQQKEELTASLNVIMHKQSELNQEKFEKQEENKRIREEIAILKRQRGEIESNVLQLRGEETALRESVKDLTLQKKDLPNQIDQLMNELEKQTSKIHKIKSEFDSTSKELDYVKEEKESIHQTIYKLKNEKLLLEKEVENLTDSKRTMSKRLEIASSMVEKEIHDSSQKNEIMNSIETLQIQKNTLEISITRLHQSLNDLENYMRDLRKKEQKLQTSYDHLQSDYSTLKKKVKNAQSDLDSLNEEKKTIKERIELLKKKQRDIESEIKRFETKLKSNEDIKTENINSNIKNTPQNKNVTDFSKLEVSSIIVQQTKEAWINSSDRAPLQVVKTPNISSIESMQTDDLKNIKRPIQDKKTSDQISKEFTLLEKLHAYHLSEKNAIKEKKINLEKAREEWKKDKESGNISSEMLQKVKQILETQAKNLNRDIEELNQLQQLITLRKEQLQLIQASQSDILESSDDVSIAPNIQSKLKKIEKDIERILKVISSSPNVPIQLDKENQNLSSKDRLNSNPIFKVKPSNIGIGRDTQVNPSHGSSHWNQFFNNYLGSEDMSINGRLWGFQEIIRDWQEKRGKERQLLNSHENWLKSFRKELELNNKWK